LNARYAELGATSLPTSPAEIKAFGESEEARLLPIMKAAGIKLERAGLRSRPDAVQRDFFMRMAAEAS
jgi:hypothetical protein